MSAPARTPNHIAVAVDAISAQSQNKAGFITALNELATLCEETGCAFLTVALPQARLQEIAETARPARESHKLTLTFVPESGGRQELSGVFRQMAAEAARGELDPVRITPALIERNLPARGLPPLDLIIYTGGQRRLGEFLLWQSAYAELLMIERPWSDFRRADAESALKDYAARSRKFGGLTPV